MTRSSEPGRDEQAGLGAPRAGRGARAPQPRAGAALARRSPGRGAVGRRRVEGRAARRRAGRRGRGRAAAGCPSRIAADWLAVAYAVFVVAYGLAPQSWLGGGATHKGVVLAARHDLLPVAAYLLGRGLELTAEERSRLCRTVLLTAAAVAAYGLADVYLVPLSWWRHNDTADWFKDQLGLRYAGLSGLPENFVYNAGRGEVFRRLTSTFLSPLATGYLLVVALFHVPLRRRYGPPVALLLFAALLWTHTRAALLALVLGLLVVAVLRRRARPLVLAVVVAVVGLVFVKEYTHFGPRTHFTAAELRYQEQHAKTAGPASNDATSANDASTSEHLDSLRDGIRTVVHHPWGFGLGNAGVTASRTHVTVRAGESTYTELGVETGLVGGLLFVAWSLALLRRLIWIPWLAATFAVVLALGLQTDVIGIPWLAVVVWAFAGAAAGRRNGTLVSVSRARGRVQSAPRGRGPPRDRSVRARVRISSCVKRPNSSCSVKCVMPSGAATRYCSSTVEIRPAPAAQRHPCDGDVAPASLAGHADGSRSTPRGDPGLEQQDPAGGDVPGERGGRQAEHVQVVREPDRAEQADDHVEAAAEVEVAHVADRSGTPAAGRARSSSMPSSASTPPSRSSTAGARGACRYRTPRRAASGPPGCARGRSARCARLGRVVLVRVDDVVEVGSARVHDLQFDGQLANEVQQICANRRATLARGTGFVPWIECASHPSSSLFSLPVRPSSCCCSCTGPSHASGRRSSGRAGLARRAS